MPIHDTIYQRLREATEAELDALARALREERTYDRDVDVTELSRKYRADGGNWFKNIPRKKDELLYRAILDDVVEAVAESAGCVQVMRTCRATSASRRSMWSARRGPRTRRAVSTSF